MGKDRGHAASYINLGRYRAGSALAQDARLGSTYRFLTDLVMPHFGGTDPQAGPDSNRQRLALTYAGRSAGRPSRCRCEPPEALKKQAGTANLHVASAYKTTTTMGLA